MTQRERFEAWARCYGGLSINKHPTGEYASDYTLAAWTAWQAACPEGWQAVPIEATEAMEIILYDWSSEIKYAWQEALKSAPNPEDA